MPHRPSEVDPLKCHRSGCWVLLWSKFWWQRTIFASWLMRQSPSLVRPQTGQGFDLLLGARFRPRVLENCPLIGLLLSYMKLARSKARWSPKTVALRNQLKAAVFWWVQVFNKFRAWPEHFDVPTFSLSVPRYSVKRARPGGRANLAPPPPAHVFILLLLALGWVWSQKAAKWVSSHKQQLFGVLSSN